MAVKGLDKEREVAAASRIADQMIDILRNSKGAKSIIEHDLPMHLNIFYNGTKDAGLIKRALTIACEKTVDNAFENETFQKLLREDTLIKKVFILK